MSAVLQTFGSVAPQATGNRSGTRASSTRRGRPRRTWLRPGWPLAALFIGYPLWWILGITEMASMGAASVMALELIRRRQIAVPRGFGVWLLFLAWVAVGAAVVQVDVPGAVPGGSSTRYLTGAFRLAWYLRATVVMLYIGNMRRELSTQWITRTLSWMFVTITVGGLAGMVVPDLSFPSLLELVLPHSMAQIPFVHSLVHPTLSELQNALGDNTLRPSAPFTYANEWGFNFACFLPFFLAAWFGRDAGWRRLAGPVVLVAALVPVIFSLNRGLWLALIAAALFVVTRSALTGKFRLLGVLLAGSALAVMVIVSTPLGNTIQSRLDSPNSNEGRTNLAVLGFTTMMENSPLVGFGTTRPVQGSFTSIAGGSTPSCPRCGPPSLGTQGQLSLVGFCQGLGGLILYFGFLGLQFLRHIRLHSPPVTLGLAVLLVHVVTTPVYGADNLGLAAVMAGVGLLWRESVTAKEAVAGRSSTSEPTLGGYARILRHHSSSIVACVVLGTALAGAWQYHEGSPAIAKVSVLLPEEPAYLTVDESGRTLDTEALLGSDAAVIDSISKAVGHDATTENGGLSITAVPNTRILNLAYKTRNATSARAGAQAAAQALLRARAADLLDRQIAAVKSLQVRSDALSAAITTIDASRATLRDHASRQRPYRESRALSERRFHLVAESGRINSRIGRAESAPVEIGHALGAPSVRQIHDGWRVSAANGMMLGLLAGLMLTLGREALGRKLSGRRSLQDGVDVPVLAELEPGQTAGDTANAPTHHHEGRDPAKGAKLYRPAAYLAVGDAPRCLLVAAQLDESIREQSSGANARGGRGQADPTLPRSNRVVLVTSHDARIRAVRHAIEGIRLTGMDVVGLVLVRG